MAARGSFGHHDFQLLALRRCERGLTLARRPREMLTLLCLFVLLITTSVTAAFAQELRQPITPTSAITPAQESITLSQAVAIAARNFPSIRYAQSKAEASRAGVTLAKTAYLPSLNLIAQELRGSTNNITGLLFPQTLDVVPTQTGQTNTSASFRSIWANNQGANLSLELYDFGLRKAGVQLARSNVSSATAAVQLTELDVVSGAAEKYLETVAAKETIRAQQATVRRMRDWNLIVQTLVKNGLRPGVDAARAEADLSMANIGLIEAERDTELGRVDLAEAMGTAGRFVDVIAFGLVKEPPQLFATSEYNIQAHPLAVLKMSDVKVADARVQVWNRSWYPHIWLHSAVWSRGSGDPRSPRVVADGILPQTANWIAGFSVSFPAFDAFRVKAEKRIAMRNAEAERANYELAIQVLTQKDRRAKVLLDNARRIARETVTLVKAARENETKALSRYKVGLTTIVEVAEAERILARAEVEDAVAEVRVWRAILAAAYAQGNLKPFLDLVAAAEARN